MGRSAMLKEPSDLVLTVCSKPVARLWILTVALVITTTELSVTVPLMEPRVCWAWAGAVSRQIRPKHARTNRDTFIISKHPFRWIGTAPLSGMYHIFDTQIECRPVDILDCPPDNCESMASK